MSTNERHAAWMLAISIAVAAFVALTMGCDERETAPHTIQLADTIRATDTVTVNHSTVDTLRLTDTLRLVDTIRVVDTVYVRRGGD